MDDKSHMMTLKQGMKSEDVRKLQSELASLGLYRESIDGDFGSHTHASVIAFQKKYGLKIDGVVGTEVYKKMQELKAPVQSLLERCLRLTGTIETGLPAPDCFGRVTGNF